MQTNLRLFGAVHIAILLSMPVLAALLCLVRKQWPDSNRAIRFVLAVILATDGVVWYGYRHFVVGLSWSHVLPLELCDISFWIIVWVLLDYNQRGFDLAYYLGAGGAAMAMLTPSLVEPLATYPSIEFLAGHGMMVVAVLYLLWSGQARPSAGSWKFAFIMLNVFAAIVGLINYITQSNYMFLCQKPPTASLFDLLGPWPWYILWTEAVAVVLFAVMQLPYSSEPFRPASIEIEQTPSPATPSQTE